MNFSDDRSRAAFEWERVKEMSVGLLFPNRGPCRHRDKLCPEIVSDYREAGLLMGYCSNNDSIKECRMYVLLEGLLGRCELMRREYVFLGERCVGASEYFREEVSRFSGEIEALCLETVGESL